MEAQRSERERIMDYSKLKPLHGIIILKVAVESNTSAGGIFLTQVGTLDYAEVVAVGPGEWRKEKGKEPEFHEVSLAVGDQVVIGPGSGVVLETEIDGEKETLTYMSEADIVAIVRK